MADMIITSQDGSKVNLGDPSNTDPRYSTGQYQLYTDAKDMMNNVSFMEELFIKTNAGPKTIEYFNAIKALSETQQIYGFLPTAPDKFSD